MELRCLVLLLFSQALVSEVLAQGSDLPDSRFHRIDALLCIKTEFVETHPEERSNVGCASLCVVDLRCQAFSLSDGPCQLFVFDKCSKSVRNCGCSKRGQVFVKRQSGLAPGALCPQGYGQVLCGVKYKWFTKSSGMTWYEARQMCDSESGLVIMADVTSPAEMSHINSLNIGPSTPSFWLGGFQQPGSAEPAGGWSWVSCEIAIKSNSSVWATGEPNNYNGNENAIIRFGSDSGLTDVNGADGDANYVLCECLSPF